MLQLRAGGNKVNRVAAGDDANKNMTALQRGSGSCGSY